MRISTATAKGLVEIAQIIGSLRKLGGKRRCSAEDAPDSAASLAIIKRLRGRLSERRREN